MITFLVADVAVEPGWAVGAVPIDDPALDRDLLIDAQGRPWVPGSSLAGSLRAHLRDVDAHRTTLETDLMGSRPPTGRGGDTEASKLWILGTRFTPTTSTAPVTEVVGQTAIDRCRSAAAAGTLRYSRAVADGGTLTVYMRHDGELTDHQLRTIAQWQPAIGRDRTTGAGQARLSTLRYGTIDPTTPADLTRWLRLQGPELVEAVATTPISGPPPSPTWLEAELRITDALLVGDPAPTGPSHPRTRNGQPLVPGSAWKGLFRSRTEYILRSLYGEHATCHQPLGCGTCPTCHVFGHQHARGRLVFHDTPIEGATQPAPRTQVGIDRVTGGPAEGLLYQTAPVTGGTIHLRIDTLGDVEPWVRTALLHVLRDLHDGLIGIGSRTTRGLGTVHLVEPPSTPGPIDVPDLAPTRCDEAAP